MLAITDASGPIGLAGIMGGDGTKADDATRHVFLESAFFYPEAIAGRARRYNFTSDASHRFERGVDFANEVEGIERGDRAHPRDLRRRAGTDRRHGRAAAGAGAGPHARRAGAQGDRARDSGRRDGGHLPAARVRVPARRFRPRRSVRRDAAVVSVRHRDRGRPHRGGRAGARLRADPGASAGRAGGHARAAGDPALAARGPRAGSPRPTTRRSSTSASSTPNGSRISPATPRRSGSSTRSRASSQ